MMHRAWSSIVEVPYYFSRSYVKFQGHTALKIIEFDPNWAFPDCNSSLNSPMAMKCCTKLETAKERCPIVFQVHPSNFKVTRDKTSPILNQIGRFRTIGRSQLSNPSDLPCLLFVSKATRYVDMIHSLLVYYVQPIVYLRRLNFCCRSLDFSHKMYSFSTRYVDMIILYWCTMYSQRSTSDDSTSAAEVLTYPTKCIHFLLNMLTWYILY